MSPQTVRLQVAQLRSLEAVVLIKREMPCFANSKLALQFVTMTTLKRKLWNRMIEHIISKVNVLVCELKRTVVQYFGTAASFQLHTEEIFVNGP